VNSDTSDFINGTRLLHFWLTFPYSAFSPGPAAKSHQAKAKEEVTAKAKEEKVSQTVAGLMSNKFNTEWLSKVYQLTASTILMNQHYSAAVSEFTSHIFTALRALHAEFLTQNAMS